MKQLKKQLAVFGLLLAMLLLPVMTSSAAVGSVGGLKARVQSETSAKLSWKKVSKATGYIVYRVQQGSGAAFKVATTKANSYTVKGLTPNTEYVYEVRAYRKSKTGTEVSEASSGTVQVKTALKKPGAPSKLNLTVSGKTSVSLSWKKASNATGYYVYMYNKDTGKYDRIGTASKTGYTVSKLTEGETNKFAVQSFRTVKGQTAVGGTVEVSGASKGLSAEASKIHGRYSNAKLRRDVTAVATDGTKVTLKKNSSVVTTSRSDGMTLVMTSSGKRVRISGKNLAYGSLKCRANAFSQSAIAAYVNEKGYSSRTKYLIFVSQYAATATVFKGSQGHWKVVRHMPCVIGQNGNTPPGIHRICKFGTASFGGPFIYFTWNGVEGNGFHRRVDGHRQGAYSHGCVRLGNDDLNFVYRNCSIGTTVVSL